MNLPGCRSARSPLASVVLKPAVYHWRRLVGWKTATSTWPSSNRSVIICSSEYFWNFSIGQCVSAGPRLWYAWKHSIPPLAYCSWPGTQFAGLASQKWECPSTTKYFTPSLTYTLPPTGSSGAGHEIEVEVFGGVLGIGEHDGPVVLVDHAPVVGGHALLELGRVEPTLFLAGGLVDLAVHEVHAADRVDPDHRVQRQHGDVALGGHHLGHDRADLVVHQGEAAHVGRGVVLLVRALGRLEHSHWPSSFGGVSSRSDRIALNRLLARSRPSSKRGGLASGCDHSGCSVRAAWMQRGTQVSSHCCISLRFSAPNCLSVTSRWNIGLV